MKEDYLPKYVKIRNKIKESINQGQIKPGDKLPTENELTKKYDASRHTVRKALNILNQEGLLNKKQGVGTFLKENTKVKTGNIGFISISLHDYIFADILNGVDNIFHEEGYQILLGNSKDSQLREKEILEKFLEKNIDGLIIEPAKSAHDYQNMALLERFVDNYIPVVILDSKFRNDKFNYITVNDEKGGYLATEFFLDKGHNNVAIIYKELHKPSINRFQGYKKALEEREIPVYNDYVKKYHISEFEKREKFEEEIFDLTKELMEYQEPPTAIFCFNDQIAILVKEILNDLELEVPQDISIIGFDNSDLVRLNNISITSIDHPKEKAGEKAAKIILENIEGSTSQFNENIVFTPKLIKRESVLDLN
ncbi:transcriptional regulator [Halobacteroides halobius DSM 5150]|uniref:Transcriptional regulator n=1 Tax=Halobacteroides halobius (strain ATCC 35273 / DSM 5150 / MD-1) TaxID=748449 RepID=L0K9J1_HALHC|nr:GntR family transcriptional regulator [Halobacteroides halobius]AGB41681.1 transcriptional regulator [Halobacteroides halobius DSM 5150]